MPSITFINVDFKAIEPFQDDLMVIIVEVEHFAIIETLVYQSSSVDILCWKNFKKRQIFESDIHPYEEKIVGFSGEMVDTKRYINLYTMFLERSLNNITIKISYLIMDA